MKPGLLELTIYDPRSSRFPLSPLSPQAGSYISTTTSSVNKRKGKKKTKKMDFKIKRNDKLEFGKERS